MTFVVQTAIHADPLTLHATATEAFAAIHALVAAGLAQPGELSVVELGRDREPRRVVAVVVDRPLPTATTRTTE